MEGDGVCVIIAARNAATTISVAIASALRESEVTEIILVDDASTDDTSKVARAASDSSGRLSLLRLDENCGPSFARNLAIARSKSPLISILDADDFFLKGRFKPLLSEPNWDFAADNLVFIDENLNTDLINFQVPFFKEPPFFLNLEDFIKGNISTHKMHRGELGFLKPVMRRDFLTRHNLRYDNNLRLGEDYELYVRALARGARFKVLRCCGYGAVVRSSSLSGQHKTHDLKALADADDKLLKMSEISQSARLTLLSHRRQVRGKYYHRRFLDIKAQEGIVAACKNSLSSWSTLKSVVVGVGVDKLNSAMRKAGFTQSTKTATRFLIPGEQTASD